MRHSYFSLSPASDNQGMPQYQFAQALDWVDMITAVPNPDYS